MPQSFYSIAPGNLTRLNDIRLWNRINYEQEKRFCPIVVYKKLLNLPEETDNVHNELPNTWKRFSEPIQLCALIKPDAETHPNVQGVVEEVRSVSMFVSVPSLVASGLAEQDQTTFLIKLSCGRGDRFYFGSPVVYEYDITELHRGETFINTDVPVYYEFRAERFRPESTEFAGLQPMIDPSLQGEQFP